MERGKNYIVFEDSCDIGENDIGIYVGGICIQPPRCSLCGEYMYIIPKDKIGENILSCEKCKRMGRMVIKEVVRECSTE